jgi:type VI secretion system secreted protein Hcp
MAGFIKIKGIEGQAIDKNHKNWIKVESVSQSLSRPMQRTASGTSTNSSVQCGNVVVQKQVDKSTPKLIGAVCKGTKIDEITIDLTTDIGQGERVTYLQWKLKNAYVSDYNVSGMAEGGGYPLENLALSYEEIEWVYTPVDEKGKAGGAIPQTWNVGAGTE